MTPRTIAILLVSLALAACSSEADGGAGGGGGGDGEGGGGGEPGPTLDLFACGIVPDCVQDSGHLGEALTEEAVRCGGELAVAGEGGALLGLNQPGPYPTEIESLVVFGPDGAAYDQIRSRCAVEDGCEEQNTTAWRRTELRRCVIDVDPAAVEGCGTEEGPCAWYGQTKDCTVVEADWTCADLPQ